MRSLKPNAWASRHSDEQRHELGTARREFDEVRPYGWQDAEAAYSKDNTLAHEAGTGRIGRTVRALYQETELRLDMQRADDFVDRWQKLDRASERQYAAGDYSGYKTARKEMGNMAYSLERDPQMESLLANRKRELGIDFDSGHSLGRNLAHQSWTWQGPGYWDLIFPICRRFPAIALRRPNTSCTTTNR